MNNPNQILDLKNGFEFTFLEDKKEWIYKAIGIPKRASGRDKPHLKTIEAIEDNYLKHYTKCLENSVKDIASYLLK